MQEIIVHVGQNNDKTVALIENGKLIEKYEETDARKRLEGNIYIGRVENVLLGMQAAFVNIGEDKNTFIHIRDIIPKVSNETGNKNEELSKHNIKNYVRVGMPILVQVNRDSTNKKGARVSTHISLSGRFVVIMPNAEFITVSQKIENEKEAKRLKELVSKYIPENYGVIIRTASQGKSAKEIENDIKKVIEKWNKIKESYVNEKDNINFKPQLLYKNDGLISKILLDVIDNNVEKIWVNDKEEYNKILKYVQKTNNDKKIKVELKEKELITMYDLDY